MNHFFDQTNRGLIAAALVLFLSTAVESRPGYAEEKKMDSAPEKILDLPSPLRKGKMSLEELLDKRTSVRSFSGRNLTRQELAQLLWAAQGITRSWGARTAPSAGALFPLEVYAVLKEGVFHYSAVKHKLVRTTEGDLRSVLAQAALNQNCLKEAPAVFVITAVYERTARKYGSRAERYVKIEAGHAAQNLLLQAAAMGLVAVPVGAFHDQQVQQALRLPADHEPIYLVPVGRPN